MDDFRQFLKEYKWRVIGIAGGIVLAVLIFTILDKGGKEGLQEALSRLFRKN